MERQMVRTREGEPRERAHYELLLSHLKDLRTRAQQGQIVMRGREHQHFNANPGTLCKFLGMVYLPWIDVMGNEMEQTGDAPDYQKADPHARY